MLRNSRPLPPVQEIQYAQVLYGWKEIGQYCRRNPTTVRRWHEERRMPIAYFGVTVVIPRSALDLWIIEGRPRRNASE